MNVDDQFRQFLLYQQLPPSIGVDHSNPLPSWDTEMEPALPEPALPVGLVEEDPGESYDPDDSSTFDPVQPLTDMQLLAEAVRDMQDFDPKSFLDQSPPVAGVDQDDDPTQFIDMSQGETFAEVFAAQPTTRLMLTNAVEALAVKSWGMDPKQAASLAGLLLGDVEGSGGGVLGLGVADFTPVGFWNDFQEAELRLGKTLNPTSVMDSVGLGSAAMDTGIAMAQAVPVPFVALKFFQKAQKYIQKYIDDVASGTIVPGALAVRSVDDAGKTVPTSEVLGATAARADTLKQATDLSPAGFYSAVRRAVDALPQEKGSAQQMRAMIAKSEGVKAEEMAWIGLDDFLKGRKNVTKQEIADFVDANQVEVVPITKDLDQAAAREESMLLQEQHMAGHITDAELLAGEKAISARQVKFGPPSESVNLPGGENWWPRLEELTDKRVTESLAELTPAERDEYLSLVAKREVFDKATGDALKEIDSQIASLVGSVPDAPFKKTWHEMSLRRVIRMAAEEGYDSVAWTPGKIQAERYDLSKQVNEIAYHAFGDETSVILKGVKGISDQDLELVLDGEGIIKVTDFGAPDDWKGKHIEDVVGKDIAENILTGSKKGRISGEGLQVGGEGMKGFYDKMLTAFAAKFGKKFGAKVGTTKVNTTAPGEPGPLVSDDVRVFHDLSEELWSDLSLSERQQLRREAEEAGVGLTEVWTIPITPKMRESVLKKGVAMFSAGAGVAVAAEGSANGS
jgi:hypothetical protein